MSKRAARQNSIGLESPTTGDRQGRRVIARGKIGHKAIAATNADAVPCSSDERSNVDYKTLAQGGRVEPARARARASKGAGRPKSRSKQSRYSSYGLVIGDES